jgi:tRNA(fMet)-specific endonuclease VapC
MTNSYLLDSSIIVECFRNNYLIQSVVANIEGTTSSSFVCLAELYEGIARVREPKKNEEQLVEFFSGLDNVFGLDKEISKEFGKIRADLKKQGEVIEDMDIFIAATCIAKDQVLMTLNGKHFKRIKDLEVLSPKDFEN